MFGAVFRVFGDLRDKLRPCLPGGWEFVQSRARTGTPSSVVHWLSGRMDGLVIGVPGAGVTYLWP